MTIATTTQRVAYTGTGTETVLSVSFKFYATSDLVVTKRTTATGAETTLTLGTHYTVQGGDGAVGSVTVVNGSVDFPLNTVTWTILRTSPQTQTLNLAQNDAFPAESAEQAHDKLVLQVQDLQEQVNRCIKFPVTDVITLDPELTHSVGRGVTGALLGFSSTGIPTINQASTLTPTTVSTTAFTQTILDDASAVAVRATMLMDGLTSTASAASIAVVSTDVALTITGVTAITNITGSVAGQRLDLHWAASATFNVTDAATGAGQIHLNNNTSLVSHVAGDVLSLLSDGTDWYERVRSPVAAAAANSVVNENTAVCNKDTLVINTQR